MGLISKKPSADLSAIPFHLALKEDESTGQHSHLSSFFPPEWYPKSGVQLTWPHAETDWRDILPEVTQCYIRMAYEISTDEKLVIVHPHTEEVKAILEERLPQRALQNIQYFECPTNDTWARDHGFITIYRDNKPVLLDFQFNGWGNKFSADLDNAINKRLFESRIVCGEYADCLDFVLEGGSLETDGEGTLLTTSQCLLNPNRNPRLNKQEIEERLKAELHVKHILWLNHGELTGDDTDSHIDTLARFCPNHTILYTRCTDKQDEQYAGLLLMEEELKSFRTAEDKPYRLIPLPLPDAITRNGERLPATYANFLVTNKKVLLPIYNQTEKDGMAVQAVQKAFPRHEIRPIDCTALIIQHGSLHCSTMQYPKNVIL